MAVRIVGIAPGMAVLVLQGGEAAQSVIGHDLLTALGVGETGLVALVVVGIHGLIAPAIGHGGEPAQEVIGVLGGIAFGVS